LLSIFTDARLESPLAWVALAATRKQLGAVQDASAESTVTAAAAAQPVAAAVTGTTAAAAAATNAAATATNTPSVAVAAAAAAVVVAATPAASPTVANQPPSVTVAWGRADATTGTVTGQLVASDPEGKKVTVKLLTAPSTGTLSYNAKTGIVAYTPTSAQRFAASASTGDSTTDMTIGLSDGFNNIGVTVKIPISPTPFYEAATVTDVNGPSSVATAGSNAYITNTSAGTVSVYDTITNTVSATYQVGTAPDGIAVKSDGSKMYVSSSTNNTVTVIDTKTGKVKATLAVTNPTAITINPAGSTVYVTNGSTSTVTKISTSTNKVTGTVTLGAGLTPTGIVVRADGARIYVISSTSTGDGNISYFTSTGKTAVTITELAGVPTGLVVSKALSMLVVTDASGGLTAVITTTNTPAAITFEQSLTGVAFTNDSSTLMVTTSAGQLAALDVTSHAIVGVATVGDTTAPTSVSPGIALSADGTTMLVTDYDTNTVHVIALVPPNNAPFSSDPSYSISNASTGALGGTVGLVDYDGDPLTYVVNAKPTKGKLALNSDGTYTYTPTAAARHAASVSGASASATTDSFTVTASDGRHGTVTTTITVAITPANTAPTVTTTIGSPSTSTGVVKGTIKSSDTNGDKRTYTLTADATKGHVTFTSTGSFTYTPSAEARAAATAPGATHDDKMDTFTITVDDGHGGVVPVTVNVKIGAANSKPTAAKPTVTAPDPRSGVVTGTVTATDADGDTLTYTAGKTTKGTIVVDADGSFSYTPTAAARAAASKSGASASTKSETITITVTDGFGGKTTTTVKVPITANPTTNTAPTNAVVTVDSTSTALGTVTGTVTAEDPDGDALTYSLNSGATFGEAKVTAAGGFTYTPDVDSRYAALAAGGNATDTFTVKITDAFGLSTTAAVTVSIAPANTSSIDQRATTVGITTQQMYFYSQADTDKAMAVLKAAGVDTIRLWIPWAGVEPTDGTYDWDAIDRMVTAADANGIKLLAAVNSTPDWAAVPGQPYLAGQPTDLSTYGEFIGAVATRYQGQIAAYEVWNEPNYHGFWSPTDATQYTALLKIAYTAIKEADPNALVIAGSVAAANETPGGSAINPVTFLTAMYAAGAAGYFDAISFHPYQYATEFSAGEGHAGMPITMAEQMYAVMVANGDGNKKIWVTEYGEPSSAVGEDEQAAYIADFLRTWRTLEFAGPAFIHTLVDYSDDSATEASMGLIHQDWTAKPALAAVTQVIEENQAIIAAATGGPSIDA
jgi:VCBS repeat-containing protein/YVTN family beta-propeller protein